MFAAASTGELGAVDEAESFFFATDVVGGRRAVCAAYAQEADLWD